MTDVLNQLRNPRLTEGCIALCDDAAEEIENLRETLGALNSAIDEYWNTKSERSIKLVCAWQQRAKHAIEFGASELPSTGLGNPK